MDMKNGPSFNALRICQSSKKREKCYFGIISPLGGLEIENQDLHFIFCINFYGKAQFWLLDHRLDCNKMEVNSKFFCFFLQYYEKNVKKTLYFSDLSEISCTEIIEDRLPKCKRINQSKVFLHIFESIVHLLTRHFKDDFWRF